MDRNSIYLETDANTGSISTLYFS